MHESRSSQGALETLLTVFRRWRIFVPFAVVTPIVVFALTSSEPSTYESSAEVLVDRQGFVIAGLEDFSFSTERRAIRTEAELARTPEVTRRAAEAAGASIGGSSVDSDEDTDVLVFRVRHGDPEQAARLATTYAAQYIAYRRLLDTKSLRTAIGVIGARLDRLRARGGDPGSYADLVQKQQQLHTALASLEANATLVSPAIGATRIAPEPVRTSLFALALGLLTGLGLAALGGLLDPRSRTADEISEQLGLPLLARLPLEGHLKRRGKALAMLRRESGPAVEAVRTLRTNLELDALVRPHGVVLVTSFVSGEGKSTTAANLAVALAKAGRNVALVDLDLRRPAIARFFNLPSSPGIADVVGGTATLEQITHVVRLDRPGRTEGQAADEPALGVLRVVTAGAGLWTDMAEIAAGRALPAALESLRERADIILLDSAPLLHASDTLTTSQYADAFLLVVHMRRYRRRYGNELRRLLTLSDATPLGLVAVGEPAPSRRLDRYADRERRVGRGIKQMGPA